MAPSLGANGVDTDASMSDAPETYHRDEMVGPDEQVFFDDERPTDDVL